MEFNLDEEEIFSAIDLTELPIVHETLSEYFVWDDSESNPTTVTSLKQYSNTQSDQPESAEVPKFPSDDQANASSSRSTTSSIGNLIDLYTTQNKEEIPQVTDDDTEEELDDANKVHLHFIESRNDEIVNISWGYSNNSTKASSFVTEKIEELFITWIDVITSKSQLVVKLRANERRHSIAKYTDNDKYVWRTFTYPASSPRENQRFAALLRILELISEAIQLNKIYTKRDIYYKDVALFGSQQFVNNLLDDIAIALGVLRRTLHVTAAAKGLVCGYLEIFKIDGTIISCSGEGEGTLIPPACDILKLHIGASKSVLIIEKEAVFRTLAESGEWKMLPAKPILLCGKGYPDIATRELAHLLYITRNIDDDYLDFHCLVDYDPHGLDIYTMYKNGSLLFGVRDHNDMAVPVLKHLGIKFSDIHECLSSEGQVASFQNVAEIAESSANTTTINNDSEERRHASKRPRLLLRNRQIGAQATGMLLLTKHDRAKATGMLQREETEYSDDLRYLLFVGYKAEIEILGDRLGRYLEEKLRCAT